MPLDARGIWHYSESDDISPFSDFMNLGMESVSNALSGVVASVGTTSQRDALHGVPTTAAARRALQEKTVTWSNTDQGKGWEERYFASFTDGGTNYNGVIVAGWYPVGGRKPYLSVSRDKTGTFARNTNVRLTADNVFESTPTIRGGMIWNNGFVTVPVGGAYQISAQFHFRAIASGAVRRIFIVKNGGSVVQSPNSFAIAYSEIFANNASSHTALTLNKTVVLAAGDALAVWVWQDAVDGLGQPDSGTSPIASSAFFSVEYSQHI